MFSKLFEHLLNFVLSAEGWTTQLLNIYKHVHPYLKVTPTLFSILLSVELPINEVFPNITWPWSFFFTWPWSNFLYSDRNSLLKYPTCTLFPGLWFAEVFHKYLVQEDNSLNGHSRERGSKLTSKFSNPKILLPSITTFPWRIWVKVTEWKS